MKMTPRESSRKRLNRAGRKHSQAVSWVAMEDSVADGPDVSLIQDYVSTAMVADLWYGGNTHQAAQDVAYRRATLAVSTELLTDSLEAGLDRP